MMLFGIICIGLGIVSCVAFAALCVRPGMRVRALTSSLPGRDLATVAVGASGSFATLGNATGEFASAKRRLGVASVSMNAALASIAAYSKQVAIVTVVVDSALEFFVPRLRGMLK